MKDWDVAEEMERRERELDKADHDYHYRKDMEAEGELDDNYDIGGDDG